MQNKVVIFDIDHTLFDTDKYLDTMFKSLQEILPDMSAENVVSVAKEAYIKMREVDVFHPRRFAEMLQQHLQRYIDMQKVIAILEDPNLLASCIYEDVHEVLQKLSEEEITLGIFSTGDKQLQRVKIQSIQNFFREKDIHIFTLKDVEVHQLLAMYEDKNVYAIDDHVRVLAEFAKQDIPSTTIWITRPNVSYYSLDVTQFTPDYRISSLSEVLAIIG